MFVQHFGRKYDFKQYRNVFKLNLPFKQDNKKLPFVIASFNKPEITFITLATTI